jgi:hypothetical protein
MGHASITTTLDPCGHFYQGEIERLGSAAGIADRANKGQMTTRTSRAWND